jgi:hypothetical protein
MFYHAWPKLVLEDNLRQSQYLGGLVSVLQCAWQVF